VEKVSLRVALMQGSVGPKSLVKTSLHKDSKGNQVNIPELECLMVMHFCGGCKANSKLETCW